MKLVEFASCCHQAWYSKERIAKTIAQQGRIKIPLLSKLLNLDELTVSIAIAYLTCSGEISIVGYTSAGKKSEQIYAEFSSCKYSLDKDKLLERVKRELPDKAFTIPGLAHMLEENQYAILNAIAVLTETGEVIDTNQSVQASDGSNTFYPLYVKSKPA
jgi:hypothetical protein